jgi:GDP-L-fucose synthase
MDLNVAITMALNRKAGIRMQRDAKIFLTGHLTMAGAAIRTALTRAGYKNLICRSPDELDLLDQYAVLDFYYHEKPDYVIETATREDGTQANNHRARLLYENLQIQINVIHGAYLARVKKLLLLGSSAIYPETAQPPVAEDKLFTGPVPPFLETYAIAKLAGIKLCQAYQEQYNCEFTALLPAALYGPNDSFSAKSPRLLPSLLQLFHEARLRDLPVVRVRGSGNMRREFLHVDDLASACLFLLSHPNAPAYLNVGMGEDISVREVTYLIKGIVGYRGDIEFETLNPDHSTRNLLSVRKIFELGWRPKISLPSGLRDTYEWFLMQPPRDNLIRS